MKLYNTSDGVIVQTDQAAYLLYGQSWDALVVRDDLRSILEQKIAKAQEIGGFDPDSAQLRAPIGNGQEVWAAGVTYFRSRDARMEESKTAGGGSFYDRVYVADRPELFFKSPPRMVVGHGQPVRIRKDSKWNVPEPELTLVVSASGKIIGYTIGNDMSSRDIEGENPLYLPQAKVYDGCCALGPGILVSDEPLPKTTKISISITRGGKIGFEGTTTLAEMKRDPKQLVEYLFREASYPAGCLLMTGTGIIPQTEFTLAHGDVIAISIDGIGTLQNGVA